MQTLLVFALALLAAVLLSGVARRSVLSTALIFVVVGFGAHALGWLKISTEAPLVGTVATTALVVTLFTDGLELSLRDLRRSWRLPGRALLVGLPITLGAIAVLARLLLGIDWLQAFLVGAVLSPTDPVFAAALIGSERVPTPVRRLLNVESGLNDGIALPIVVILLGAAEGSGGTPALDAILDVVIGVGIGGAVPLGAVRLYRTPAFGASPVYRPLFAVAVLLVAWSLAGLVRANEFLASFAAGVVLATISRKARASIEGAARSVTELLKLAALLLFIGAVSLRDLFAFGWRSVLLVLGTLLVARPLGVMIALVASELGWKERLAAAWFGPKGFASVLFGLLVLHSSLPNRRELFGAIALVTTVSIVAHSTTDFLVARWLTGGPPEEGREKAVEDVARAD